MRRIYCFVTSLVRVVTISASVLALCTATVLAQKEGPWDTTYKVTPAELCPAQDDVRPLVSAPVFGVFRRLNTRTQARDGLYVNRQGEFFRIRVIGSTAAAGRSAIQAYTSRVMVCIDHLLSNDQSTQTEKPVRSGAVRGALIETWLATHTRDLLIKTEFLGLVPDSTLSVKEYDDLVKAFVVKYPSTEWDKQLGEYLADRSLKYTDRDQLLAESKQDFFIDFIFDPAINRGVFHDYQEYTQRWVTETVNVGSANGAGSVKGNLCRNGVRISQATVTHGVQPESAAQSHDSGANRTSQYDYSVNGMLNNSRYQLTGRWSKNWNDAYVAQGQIMCR